MQGRTKPGPDLRGSQTRTQKRREDHRGWNPQNRDSDRRDIQESHGQREGKGPAQRNASELDQKQEIAAGHAVEANSPNSTLAGDHRRLYISPDIHLLTW
jgi:hypothetical protein